MVKSNIDLRSDSKEELQEILSNWWSDCILINHCTLRGGYSGTNYKLETHDGKIAVLKICNGYDLPAVEKQAQIMNHLKEYGFNGACYPYPLHNSITYTCLTKDDQPAILLNFIQGRAADIVVESGVVSLQHMLTSVGRNLALLHSTKINNSSNLLSYIDGGCCLLGKHITNDIKRIFNESTDEFIINHPFLTFYFERVDTLCRDVCLPNIPMGIVHGDPFLDNVFVDEITGEFRSFVDFEDTCIGPLVFDIACTVAGSSFNDDDNTLQLDRITALLSGYHAGRAVSSPLTDTEILLLPNFICHALLCNASWRFINFNITHPDQREQNGARYFELQQRLIAIENPTVLTALSSIIATITADSSTTTTMATASTT
eukprot:gene7025-14294_t